MIEQTPTTSLEQLNKALKVTAGCRFNAARRLQDHDRKLTRVTAFASGYIIAITVMPYFVSLPKPTADVYNLVTVILSIVILVSSLLQYSSGDVVNAEQHHRSALEMNELRRLLNLKAENNISPEDLRDFIGRYNAVLQKYSVNHDESDFAKYQVENPDMYPWVKRWQRFQIRVGLFYKRHFLSLFLFVMTAAILALVVYGLAHMASDAK